MLLSHQAGRPGRNARNRCGGRCYRRMYTWVNPMRAATRVCHSCGTPISTSLFLYVQKEEKHMFTRAQIRALPVSIHPSRYTSIHSVYVCAPRCARFNPLGSPDTHLSMYRSIYSTQTAIYSPLPRRACPRWSIRSCATPWIRLSLSI